MRRLLMGWFVFAACAVCAAEDYRAGVSRVEITPTEALWAGGYASRQAAVSETEQELWAKVLVLQDGGGYRIVFVTMDVENVPGAFAESVAGELCGRFGLRREQIAVCCSHTHSGPVLWSLEAQITYPMGPDQLAATRRYTQGLAKKLVEATGKAMGSLGPADLAYGVGRADFAVNRRNNNEADVAKEGYEPKDPVDYDVPVLRVTDGEGRLRAVLFGYACHCTTMSFSRWCGDYAGYAQAAVEGAHPGVTALFVAGCGGDINPMPRRKLASCKAHGRALAGAVEKAVAGTMRPIEGEFGAGLRRIDLAFEKLPTREDLARQAAEGNAFEKRRAKLLLAEIEAGRGLSGSYPYPIQVVQLGEELTAVVLGGEAVVDYSLRLKRELGAGRTWVFAYANDVCAYIPSERVLKEGGYEGGTSMVYFGRPATWAAGLEGRIVATVRELAEGLRGR